MQADVESGAIVVEGDVKGNLTASDRVELKQTAHYEGDLRASKLVVDEGAVFTGHVTERERILCCIGHDLNRAVLLIEIMRRCPGVD